MLSVAPSLDAAPPPTNRALNAFASAREAVGQENSPSFSHAFSANKIAKPEPTFKSSPRPGRRASDSKEETPPDKTSHSVFHSSSQAPVPFPVTAPTANTPSQANGVPAEDAKASEKNAAQSGTSSDPVRSVVGGQGEAENGIGSPASAVSAEQQSAAASTAPTEAVPAGNSSAQSPLLVFDHELGCHVIRANGDSKASVEDQDAANVVDACDALNTTGAPTTWQASPANSPPRLQAEAANAAPSNEQANSAGQNAQSGAKPAERAAQTSNTLSLSTAAALISAVTEENATPLPQAAQGNRQSTAHEVQPVLPSVEANVAANAAPGAQTPTAENSNTSSGGSDSGTASSHSGAHSMAQIQSSASAHSESDAKSSAAPDSSRSTGQQGSGATNGPQSTWSANSDPSATALLTPSAHVVAHAATQTSPPAGLPAAAKSLLNNMPSTNQLSSHVSSAVTSLPRSLNAVNQAAQFYQRIGGAEMHISMDADALGSIDLRAVVHQGSLSATIGVQRADVQTLLVNELPALQHSLAEKNLQVNQISVLAGSVSGGTNPDSQPRDQQNRQRTARAPTPTLRDAPAPMTASRASLSEVAALSSGSRRLSVMA